MTEQEVRDFLAQFDRAREDFNNWPKWMQDAAVERAAAFPRAPGAPGVPPSDALTAQEHATQIAEALADLPAQLRAHPGIKRLYRAAVSGVPGTSTAEPSLGHSTPEVCNGCGAIESRGEAHNATCGVPASFDDQPEQPR